MKKLIAIVGTNSDQSTNRQLLQCMQKHFANDAEIELAEIKDFPMFNKPVDKTLPECIQKLAAKIDAADGVIISTPEYDHAVPAALINALNWLSYGIYPFVDKPVMITGASYGVLGSSRAQAQLRQMLDAPELRARIMPSSEFLLANSLTAFDADNRLLDRESVKKLDGLFADFMIFIDITAQLNHAHNQNKKEAKEFSWDKL
ncbi:NADPH-dependent FMN reductase [Lapidilactobacillus mulanensis]|uniref:NADPH-dependent FMN reductase n=1 Tax=Lapidilactobacillus mulanensis TaxID=2485999 RepID=A0ABW4DL99_9LACO|nr:NADPH-dependent FMN reductase [Lapidilactobacillus mulanensis]